MKHLLIYSLAILLVVGFFSCSKEKMSDVTLTNPTEIERPNAMVVITRDNLLNELGDIPEDQIPIVRDSEGQSLPYQLDDLNGDGEWDELAFTTSIEANSTKEVTIGLISENEKPEFTQNTNIRFVELDNPEKEIKEAVRLESGDTEITSEIWQMEGPAWENELVGFRNYLDARNGYDIFGKVTSDMALDKAGINGQNYHEMDDWGMDILKVGNSLGAGGTAIKSEKHLIRVGSTGKNTYKYLTEGPVRTMLRLDYQIKIPERDPIEMVRRVSIRKGEYGYRSQLHFSNISNEDTLIVGIVNMHEAELISENAGDKRYIIANHEQQSVNKEYLGMGLILPREYFISSGQYDEDHEIIPETYFGKLEIPEDNQLSFFFFSGWEETNTSFVKEEFFTEKLQQQSVLLENPIEIKF